MKTQSSIKFLLFCLCLGVWFNILTVTKVGAQTCDCIVINKQGFPYGQEVKVWIDPAISGLRRDNTVLAFRNWEAARYDNNSMVTYTFVTSRPSNNEYSIIVNSGLIADGARGEASSPTDSNGYTLQATITLDSRTGTTNPAAVLDVMAHEISHPMGFGNSDCDAAQSVTGPGPAHQGDYYNALSSRPTSPSVCDNQTLRTTNYENARCVNVGDELACPNLPGRWDPITCTCYPASPGGGGGSFYPEPSHYCTPYYWVYYESWDGGRTWEMVSLSYAGCW